MNKALAELRALRSTETPTDGTCKTPKRAFDPFAGSLPKHFPQHSCVRYANETEQEKGVELPEMPLSEFASSGLYREVNSRILAEQVIFAADNAEIPPGCNLVVYRASELAEVTGLDPKALRKIHAIKKALDGEVLGGANTES